MTEDEARQAIIDTARAMQSGDIDLVSGCRKICSLRGKIRTLDRTILFPIIVFESDTDYYPTNPSRALYSKSLLARMDKQLEAYIQASRSDVLDACQTIIDALGPTGSGESSN
ncbi:MAG TPA: hypothetical protein P5572_01360 [Phycisphaerae bacterium]|nr:hypothetical protein [Phycisphaerales bacterium]HRX83646.1 hypothetical protein [Phycisphaerae bacterium]